MHGGVRALTAEDGRTFVWLADLQVSCTKCGQPFEAIGLTPSATLDGPSCDATGLVVSLPLRPSNHVKDRVTTVDRAERRRQLRGVH